jgi:hypothetical protein
MRLKSSLTVVFTGSLWALSISAVSAETIQLSLGHSFYRPGLGTLRQQIRTRGEQGLDRADAPNLSVAARLDTRWFWLGLSYERYAAESEAGGTEVEIESLVPSLLLRLDLINVIPYLGLGYDLTSMEVADTDAVLGVEIESESGRKPAGPVMLGGVVYKYNRWVGADLGFVWRPRSTIKITGTEYDFSDFNWNMSWSFYF